jgi:hypothetical protein
MQVADLAPSFWGVKNEPFPVPKPSLKSAKTRVAT